MTVADQVATDNHVVATGKVDGWLALKILAVEQFAVFNRNVGCLVELNELEAIIVLQRIVRAQPPGHA
jgi:hypothetical protein